MAEFNETLEVAVNDGLSVSFYKGLRANLPVVGVDGVYYQCTDTGELFLGTGTGMKQVTKEIDLTDYATKEDLQNVPHAETATDLTGRVEATPEVFTYRPSAGDKSIKDDNAFIRRVKGNSIIMNQIVPDVMTIQDGTGSLADHTYTITPTGSYPGIKGAFNKLIPDGHKILLSMDLRIEGVSQPKIGINIQGGINASLSYTSNSTGLTNFAQIITMAGAKNYNITFFADASATLITIARPQIIDLTTMFGTGNEPTTVEEFRAFYPNSYYPYNAGELRNLVCNGIKTVGFNLIDKNYFLTGVISGSDTPFQNSNYYYIKVPVFPNTEYYLKDVSNLYYYTSYVLYDSNMNRIKAGGIVVRDSYPYNASFVMTTPSNAAYMIVNVHKDFVDTCCINLHHTGYRDGEYEPYKEVTHELPLDVITNGEPLRKAGSVYDEINETEYIRRVGVRAYTAGDEQDETLMTDLTYTNYSLDEPIVTPIETPIDFNYYVEDFGTEEALLAEDSAPFSADIIYQFNAVDRIRQNDLNIDRLEETIYNLDQSIKGKAESAEIFPISLESLYAVAEGETVSADKYSIKEMLYRQQEGLNDLLLLNDGGLTVGYVVGGVVGDSLQFSAYTNDGKLIKVVASESEDELTESDVEVFDLLSSGEPNSQLAYAEYTGTATAAVVTTKYGYFPTTLVEGASVAVKFEGSLTYITTLNVNGTGAKNVYYKGNSLASGTISRYNTYIFVYDGSYYRIVGIDTDTHYTAKNVVTSSSTSKSNATATNGNVYLNAVENSTVRSTHKIVGTGATAVTSDASGNITIDTPIKTINGESIVGSGDITISGGSGGSSSGSGAYPEVDGEEYRDEVHIIPEYIVEAMQPNKFYVFPECVVLDIQFDPNPPSGIANEYLFQFTSGSEPTTLRLPDDIKWTSELVIEPNKIYQISILKGLGSVLSWDNAPTLIDNKVTVSISGTKYLVSLQYAAASNIVVKVRTADGPISVNVLSGEVSKTASSLAPMVDSDAYIESITPVVDNKYNYTW